MYHTDSPSECPSFSYPWHSRSGKLKSIQLFIACRALHLNALSCPFLLLTTKYSSTGKSHKMPRLASARYGKDNVRVYKVHRDEATGVQTVTEMTVTCLLEGQIETS